MRLLDSVAWSGPVIGDPCPFLVSVPLPGASDVCVAFADAVPVERHLNGVCGRQARYVPQRAKPKSCPKAIDRLLAEAGSDKTRILQATIFLKSIADFPAMNSVWDGWVPSGHTPPRATVEARLAKPDYLVEIKVIAAQA